MEQTVWKSLTLGGLLYCKEIDERCFRFLELRLPDDSVAEYMSSPDCFYVVGAVVALRQKKGNLPADLQGAAARMFRCMKIIEMDFAFECESFESAVQYLQRRIKEDI